MENITKIEKKWQDKWEEEQIYKFDKDSKKEKLYCLEMFSYPSGANLHMGHWWNYGVSDSWARLKRMQGYNVFHPMGFDAFGLPAENYAIKTGVHPDVSTKENIKTMQKQLRGIGATYDWDYEIDTSSPDYYKWTQWLFLKFYEKGLAYKKEAPVNWCPSCHTVLANEQVINGECERCDSVINRKKMSQWFFKITDYADELLSDLDKIDWPERTKVLQRNWIGKSEGATVTFKVGENSFDVYTTRPDTLYGATYAVLAPEHELVDIITTAKEKQAVENYKLEATKLSEIDRTSTVKEKTGVFTGAYAVNPINNKEIPIWIADYVLEGYGTGAIMAVPAHDQRDFEFAKKFNLDIIPVVKKVIKHNDKPNNKFIAVVFNTKTNKYLTKNKEFIFGDVISNPIDNAKELLTKSYNLNNLKYLHSSFPILDNNNYELIYFETNENVNDDNWMDEATILNEIKDELNLTAYEFREEKAYTEDGIIINSEIINGLTKDQAINKISDYLKEKNHGYKTTNYKLRDWLVSRQRYWGSPIPIIYCDDCGIVPVPEKDLPVILPYDAEFTPDGDSPLKKSETFRNVKCPKCNKDAQRECDTLDTFVCSSWYFLRFPDANNNKEAFNKQTVNKLLPVDKYIGGIEHAVMHLLYARFFTKALRDMGCIDFDEPFKSLVHQGIILGPDGEKMSKSRGNTVTPDPIVQEFGSDILRNYLMFGFNYIDGGPWTDDGIIAMNRFYKKIERLIRSYSENTEPREIPEIEKILHHTIKSVIEDTDEFQFNTSIARIMEYSNMLVKYEREGIPKYYLEQLLLLLAPFAPHITEELWCEVLNNKFSIHNEEYPVFDETKLKSSTIEVGVQVNGKLRGSISITENMDKEEITNLAKTEENVSKHIKDKEIIKVIIIPKKIVSFVVR